MRVSSIEDIKERRRRHRKSTENRWTKMTVYDRQECQIKQGSRHNIYYRKLDKKDIKFTITIDPPPKEYYTFYTSYTRGKNAIRKNGFQNRRIFGGGIAKKITR